MENKIDKETAEREFFRFGDEMELDFNESEMNPEELETFTEIKAKMIKAQMNGSLVFNDVGEPIFTPRRSGDVKPLHFREPTGASLMAMDQKKQNQQVGKLQMVMGELSKRPPVTFAKLALADFKVCSAIVTCFLGL